MKKKHGKHLCFRNALQTRMWKHVVLTCDKASNKHKFCVFSHVQVTCVFACCAHLFHRMSNAFHTFNSHCLHVYAFIHIWRQYYSHVQIACFCTFFNAILTSIDSHVCVFSACKSYTCVRIYHNMSALPVQKTCWNQQVSMPESHGVPPLSSPPVGALFRRRVSWRRQSSTMKNFT